SAIGPVRPNPEIEQTIRRGFVLSSAGGSRPSLRALSGRKFSRTMSLRPTSRSKIALPSASLRSSVIDFLLRLQARKYALRGPTNGGPQDRVSSPAPGRSILTTSAPRSPRICPHNGPASTRDASRTRRPVKGAFPDIDPPTTFYGRVRLCSPHAPREVSRIRDGHSLWQFGDPHAESEGYIGAPT